MWIAPLAPHNLCGGAGPCLTIPASCVLAQQGDLKHTSLPGEGACSLPGSSYSSSCTNFRADVAIFGYNLVKLVENHSLGHEQNKWTESECFPWQQPILALLHAFVFSPFLGLSYCATVRGGSEWEEGSLSKEKQTSLTSPHSLLFLKKLKNRSTVL